MNQIPLVPKLQPDELFYSYVLRTAYANGYKSPSAFFYDFGVIHKNNFQFTHRKFVLKYDTNYDFSVFCHNLGCDDKDISNIYINSTLFPLISFFGNDDEICLHYSNLVKREYPNILYTKKYFTFISDIKYCPECAKEDKVFYLHRSHQIPGVNFCHKHKCRLLFYKGRPGNELDPDKYSEIIKNNQNEQIEISFSVFIYDLLNCKQNIRNHSIITALKEFASNYIEQDCDLNTFYYAIRKNIYLVSEIVKVYSSIPEKELLENSLLASKKIEFMSAIQDKYTLTSQYTPQLVTLKCNTCNHHFFSSPYRILSGYGCPDCDMKIPASQLYRRLFEASAKGEYLLLSEFTDFRSSIRIKHLGCGKEYNLLPKSFTIEHIKCTCKEIKFKTELADKISKTGDFELIEYKGSKDPAKVKHLGCNCTFEVDISKFFRSPFCRICESNNRSHSSFVNEIKNLVGDEYTLVNHYIDKDTHVQILHNKCGNSQSYLPRHFLDGQRCSHCNTFVRHNQLAEIVSTVTNNQYSLKEKVNNNLVLIVDNSTKLEYKLPPKKVIQELYMPGNSKVLPCDSRNLIDIQNTSPKIALLNYIKNNFSQNELILLEDLDACEKMGISHSNKKKILQWLIERNYLRRITKGIYCFPDASLSNIDILYQKYIFHNGNFIGYYYGTSFAFYELNMEVFVEYPQVTSNLSGKTHPRRMYSFNFPMKVRGSEVLIDNDNHRILAILSFLNSQRKLYKLKKSLVIQKLREYMQKHNISQTQVEKYLAYFPFYVQEKFIEVING